VAGGIGDRVGGGNGGGVAVWVPTGVREGPGTGGGSVMGGESVGVGRGEVGSVGVGSGEMGSVGVGRGGLGLFVGAGSGEVGSVGVGSGEVGSVGVGGGEMGEKGTSARRPIASLGRCGANASREAARGPGSQATRRKTVRQTNRLATDRLKRMAFTPFPRQVVLRWDTLPVVVIVTQRYKGHKLLA
jgi:hypothetical protein